MIVVNGKFVVKQKVLKGGSQMEIKDEVRLRCWKKWLGMIDRN